jgi:hypothetical protein
MDDVDMDVSSSPRNLAYLENSLHPLRVRKSKLNDGTIDCFALALMQSAVHISGDFMWISSTAVEAFVRKVRLRGLPSNPQEEQKYKATLGIKNGEDFAANGKNMLKKHLLICLNNNNKHWSLLLVKQRRDKGDKCEQSLYHYDSSKNNEYNWRFCTDLVPLLKSCKVVNGDSFPRKVTLPSQRGIYECGHHVCAYALYVTATRRHIKKKDAKIFEELKPSKWGLFIKKMIESSQ